MLKKRGLQDIKELLVLSNVGFQIHVGESIGQVLGWYVLYRLVEMSSR